MSNCHTTSPVAALSALMVPRSPPVYWPSRLIGTVLTSTSPAATWGWMSMPAVGVSTSSVVHCSSPVSTSRAVTAFMPLVA